MSHKMDNVKLNIASSYFEFQKRKALLETGIGIKLDGFTYIPLDVTQEYIYSLLFVDLISIFSNAAKYILKLNSIKASSTLNRNLKLLESKDLLIKPLYDNWYRDLRNKITHDIHRIEWYILRQASEDISIQMITWKLAFDIEVRKNIIKQTDKLFDIVVLANKTEILKYHIEFNSDNLSLGTASWSTVLDLDLRQYLKFN
jgi:hypothetical protein